MRAEVVGRADTNGHAGASYETASGSNGAGHRNTVAAELIGESEAMRRVWAQVDAVAGTPATVLIRGESGTGKELVARAIHDASPRAAMPFVSVNCAALPPTLIESELFGHEKGAFTGAHARKIGLFERSNRGTLFLDEIGDLDTGLQVKLLRVLQQREIQRIGGEGAITVDVRVIAATHRDLEAAIAEGSFREDLYYRLDVFSIVVPPLRDRREDVAALARHFITRYAGEYGRPARRLAPAAAARLQAYGWPGNVRELENVVIRAVLQADSEEIEAHHLPATVNGGEEKLPGSGGSLAEMVGNFERTLIENTLRTTRGNRTKAARLLKTTERILNYRIRRYRIDCNRFRG